MRIYNYLNNKISNIKEKFSIILDKYTVLHKEKDNKFYTKFLNGDCYYYDENENYHNNEGPAINTRFRKEYFLHGKRHRIDGPAVIFLHSTEKRIIYTEYWLYGERILFVNSDDEFKKVVRLKSFI